MQTRKVTMNKLREMLRLRQMCGLTLRKIARVMKLSRPVVTEYLARCDAIGLDYETAKDLPDDALNARLRTVDKDDSKDTRYQTLQERFAYMSKELTRVGVTRMRLWEEYTHDHPDGYGYSQFCHHYQKWARQQKLSMHIEHKAGEELFVDFAGKKLAIVDRETGEVRNVEVFVAILGASQLIYVEAVMSQKKRDFLAATDNALWYMGGVPAAIIPDNVKSAVTKADRYEPDINPEYVEFARHYNLAILPARPYKPKDKALVEGAVRIVYQQIYAPLRDRAWHSLAELNGAIRQELEALNNRPMKEYGASRRARFEEIERVALRPLPAERFPLREHSRMKVAFNYHVYLRADTHYYSVPYRCRGEYVDIYYGEQTVEIYHKNERIAVHVRNRRPYGYSTIADHMPPQHRYKDDWNAERFLSWAEAIDGDVKTFIDRVLASRRHPEQAYKSCLGILSLARTYGNERLAHACRIALQYELYTYKGLANILKHNLATKDTPDTSFDTPLPVHENIRGCAYYQTEATQ